MKLKVSFNFSNFNSNFNSDGLFNQSIQIKATTVNGRLTESEINDTMFLMPTNRTLNSRKLIPLTIHNAVWNVVKEHVPAYD